MCSVHISYREDCEYIKDVLSVYIYYEYSLTHSCLSNAHHLLMNDSVRHNTGHVMMLVQ